MRYDPAHQSNRGLWTDLDESEQIALVAEFHRRARIKLPDSQLHTTMHVIVENQAFMDDETPVAATLARLIDEGLSRHDAVHAIASVLAVQIFNTLQRHVEGDPNALYFRKVSELTASKWRSPADDGAVP